MASGAVREHAELVAGFTRWFGREVTLARPSAGLSSETVFVTVGDEELVVRLPPTGDALFPDYDLPRQVAVQQAVADAGLPVPTARLETDTAVVGAPFMVMPRVPGHVLSAMPPYTVKGWLAEQDAERQGQVLTTFLQTMARINSLDPATLALPALSAGGSDLAAQVTWWRDYLTWAGGDEATAEPYARGLDWLAANVPTEVGPTTVLWGDPQLVNLVLDDAGGIAAVLDWEMASLGPAEVDLAWFLVLHEGTVETSRRPELPGFGDRATKVATYAEALGRELHDLTWYEVFAHVRSGAIVVRSAELMRRAGMDVSWVRHLPQPRHLERLTA